MSNRPDIGKVLSDTRAGFGWSLDDVAHRTRIPVATLHQLEGNDYAKFPSRAYAKSFLFQYSDYLGLDLAEWLDTFETGDALANLDRYEYLKDHDERVDAAPLGLQPRRQKSRQPSQRQKPRERTAARAPSAALQPLYVFLVTAALVTGAVFGFMKLSEKLSEDASAEASQPANEERLKPVSGISVSRPDFRDLSQVPRALPISSDEDLVAGEPATSQDAETLTTTSSTQANGPDSQDGPKSSPPRAVIVEE